MRALGVTVLLAALGCKGEPPQRKLPEPTPEQAQDKRDRDEYVSDVMAFTGQTRQEVRDRMKLGAKPLAREWEAWEARGEMTDERIKAFYKETTNYIYELGEWHLWDREKRESDLAFLDSMRAFAPKNILDFGGGVGLLAIPLARAGFDVTLSDLDSTTLEFAAFRAKRHGDKLAIWKSDIEDMPPDAKYDVILALDVLEHLPKDELDIAVDKLIKLKHAKTIIVMSAPFGRTSTHPMHLDADAHTKQQVDRLQNELPK